MVQRGKMKFNSVNLIAIDEPDPALSSGEVLTPIISTIRRFQGADVPLLYPRYPSFATRMLTLYSPGLPKEVNPAPHTR